MLPIHRLRPVSSMTAIERRSVSCRIKCAREPNDLNCVVLVTPCCSTTSRRRPSWRVPVGR